MIELILCISLAIFANFITNTMHLLSIEKQRAFCLQTGGGSRFFTEPRSKDFYDQPKAPLPPLAPNINRSIPKLSGNRNIHISNKFPWKDTSTQDWFSS